MDRYQLDSGDSLAPKINEALRKTRVGVLLITKKAPGQPELAPLRTGHSVLHVADQWASPAAIAHLAWRSGKTYWIISRCLRLASR